MKTLEKYVAFDVEFNTVDEIEHLIQVSAVSFENGQEIAAFDSYVYSDVPVNSFVVGLTGITQEKVLTAPKASEALSKLKVLFPTYLSLAITHTSQTYLFYLKMALI